MSKRLLTVALALMLVLGLSGFAWAMLCEIDQDGSYNFAFVGQYDADANTCEIKQEDSGICNVAFVVQVAADNTADIDQLGEINIALVEQNDLLVSVMFHSIQDKVDWALDSFDDFTFTW